MFGTLPQEIGGGAREGRNAGVPTVENALAIRRFDADKAVIFDKFLISKVYTSRKSYTLTL